MWALPVRREATALELYIFSTINWLVGLFDGVFRDTPFEYWLLDPRGQLNTMLMTAALGILTWLLYAQYSIRHLKISSALLPIPVQDNISSSGNTIPDPTNAPRQSSSPPEHHVFRRSESPSPEPILPTMRQLAPPGHRPTNAQLNLSPFRVVQPLGARTGRPTTPGYQTPFSSKTATANAFSTRPLVSMQNNNNFSVLANDAPVSYQRLQGNGMSKVNDTPNA